MQCEVRFDESEFALVLLGGSQSQLGFINVHTTHAHLLLYINVCKYKYLN